MPGDDVGGTLVAPPTSPSAVHGLALAGSGPGGPVTLPGGATGTLDSSVRRIRREHVGLLFRSPTFIVGGAILLFWIVCAVAGKAFSPFNPLAQNLLVINSPPSATHWFGTDALGEDMLSRVIVGSHSILVIAPLATLLGTAVGTALGLVMGYFGGWIDNVIGRLVEAVLALPGTIVAFMFIVALGPKTQTLILVIGFVFALIIARTVRTAVLQERELDYVAAAKLRDEGAAHIMFVEILPNVFAPILVEFTVRLGYAIFAIATLSFLGFGIQPPTPDWGADIASNYGLLSAGYWWETLFPALAVASLIIAVNLVGDSIEAVVIQ